MNYLLNIGMSLSHLLNAVLGSRKRMTLSGRAHVAFKEGHPAGWLFVLIINRIFFWQEDHCERSWRGDVKHAGEILSLHARLKK
jgi:hypothetical protein